MSACHAEDREFKSRRPRLKYKTHLKWWVLYFKGFDSLNLYERKRTEFYYELPQYILEKFIIHEDEVRVNLEKYPGLTFISQAFFILDECF